MEKLTLESVIKKGKYAKKSVADLVKEKGVIFSMIKEGYEFDDEVLEKARIKKIISNVRTCCCVGGTDYSKITNSNLPKDTASIKQILSELNTLDNIGGDNDEESRDYDNEIDTIDDFE